MEENLDFLTNEILSELNSGNRQTNWNYLWNYEGLAAKFDEWRSESGGEFKENLQAYMGKIWPEEKIESFVAGVQSPTIKDLEEFAEATNIDMSVYAYVEIHKAEGLVGWAIFSYERFNEEPYEVVKIFRHKHEMELYISKNLVGYK